MGFEWLCLVIVYVDVVRVGDIGIESIIYVVSDNVFGVGNMDV